MVWNAGLLAITNGGAADVLQAGSGNETLLGGLSTGANTFIAGSGNDSIVGGLGNDTIQAGTGTDVEYGSLGRNVFSFVNGQAGGTVTIGDFGLSSGNKIDLQGYGDAAVAQAVSSQVSAHGSTMLTLSDNTSITLIGVHHVSASNFA